MSTGRVIVTYNYKGGVGKTTLSVNLAAALALLGNRTIVVDNDPQSNATTILSPPSTRIENTLYEIYENAISGSPPMNPKNLKTFCYPSHHKNLYFIPNSSETSVLEFDLVRKYPQSAPFLAKQLRQFLTNEFDYTIIDCAPSMSLFIVNALFASDFIIVPVNSGSQNSIEGMDKALSLINDINEIGKQDPKDYYPSLRFLRMAINSVDRRTIISRAMAEQLHSIYGSDKIFKNHIPICTLFQQAESNRETIFKVSSRCTGATAYKAMGQELIDLFENGIKQAASS